MYQNEGHLYPGARVFIPSSLKRTSDLGSVLQSLNKKPKISTLVGVRVAIPCDSLERMNALYITHIHAGEVST